MAGQLLSSKVVVVEEEPQVRGIPSLPTSVAGAVGITERGPIGEAVLVNSFEEFQERFGGWPSGACVEFGCDPVGGTGCGEGAVCVAAGGGDGLCAGPRERAQI